MTIQRLPLFGIEIDIVDRAAALDRLCDWLREDRIGRYVVTPNVDHVVKLQERADFREAYRGASLVIADGVPIVWASRLVGRPLPGVVTGSDITPALFERAQSIGGMRVFLLGAAPGVADRAAERIRQRWPAVTVCGTCSPAPGFEKDPESNDRIIDQIRHADPTLLVIGLGAPKQELWAARFSNQLPARVTLCVGATIDFLAGQVKRAPPWLQGTGFEWVHRLVGEPSRLGPRYLRDAMVFPRLLVREWWQASGRR